MKDEQVFHIHDNGSIPFEVTIDSGQLIVKDTKTNTVILTITESLMIFIGESPVTDMTTFSGGHGPAFRGNSILVKTNELTYTYIGARIYSFQADSEIVTYISEVGNSDVPYPYAIDNNDRYYLMIEDVILDNLDPEYHKDPYFYLYGITGAQASEVLGISHLIGKDPDEHFNISYTPYPRKHYNQSWMNNLHAVSYSGESNPITEDGYISMMATLEQAFQVRPLKIEETIAG